MTRRSLRRALVGGLVAAALGLTACAGGGAGTAEAGGGEASDAPSEVSGELRIFAAASLGNAFDELATEFEQRHPDVDVLPISYDGSSTLATQIIEGAPADVFASADESSMQKVVDAGMAADPALFASNTLVIAVPAGNPAGVTGIGDLADPSLTVVLCAPEVPCGAASIALLDANDVTASAAGVEQNVTAVLTKVAAGEADAGLVYATDVLDRSDVEPVDAAGAEDVVNRYPVAALTEAADPAAAAAFVEFVLSVDGRAVLDRFGFGAP